MDGGFRLALPNVWLAPSDPRGRRLGENKNYMEKIWAIIRCWFNDHDLEIFESKMVRGILFGRMVEAHRWKCKKCGWTRPDWSVTESI